MGIPYFRTHPNIILWVLYPIFSLKPNKSHLDTMMYIYIYFIDIHPQFFLSLSFASLGFSLTAALGRWNGTASAGTAGKAGTTAKFLGLLPLEFFLKLLHMSWGKRTSVCLILFNFVGVSGTGATCWLVTAIRPDKTKYISMRLRIATPKLDRKNNKIPLKEC